MKSRLATILSIAGVLVAGSAAALVNTQALNAAGHGSDALGATAAAPAVVATDLTTPPGSAATISVGAVGAAPAVTTESVFTVGDSGVVTVDRAGDVLTLVSATPAAGWQVVAAGPTSPIEVRVVFRSSNVEVTFTADLLDGGVTTSADARELSSPAPATPSAVVSASGGTGSHDDHEGSHESDHGGGDD